MATLTSSLIVALIDKVSQPARAAASAIKGIAQAAASANQGGLARMAQANSRALAGMRASMLEATAVGYALTRSLAAPLSVAGEFESILMDIGQKSDLSNEAIKAMGERIRALAPQVNKTAGEVAAGVDILTSMGLDPGRAMAIIPQIGKAATAYRAEISDVSRATYAVIDNLKVPVSEVAKVLDVLSLASKEGAVELSDMAREFPSIAAVGQAVGEKGVQGVARLASALEALRPAFGDSSSAATGFRDVLMKSTSDEVVKRFSKAAVPIDIKKTLANARKSGADIMETLAAATMKAIKGDTSKIGEIWTDKEARIAMTGFIANWARYREIRKKAFEANGIVEQDFARRMETYEAKAKAFRVALENIGIAIGNTLLPTMNSMLKAVAPLVERMERFAEANPELVAGIIKVTAALIGMSIAGRAARWAFLFMRGGLLTFAQPALKAAMAVGGIAKALLITPVIGAAARSLGFLKAAFVGARGTGLGMQAALALFTGASGLKAVALGFLRLLNPVRLVTALFAGVRVALAAFGPIGWLIAAIATAIAAAGVFVYNNWRGIGAFFSSFGDAFMAALGPAKPLLDKLSPAIEWLGKQASWLWEQISGLLGEISPATWASWGAAAGAAVGNLAVGIMELPGRIASLGEELYTGGLAWMGRMYDGVVQGFRNVVDFFASIPRMLFELGGDPGVQFYESGLQWMGRLWDGLKATAAEIIGWIGGVAEKIAGVFIGLGGKVRAAFGLEPVKEEKSFEQRIVDAHERRKKASNDNAPAPSVPKKRATLRIIGNPEDGATEPADAMPGIEPSVMPPDLAPRIDTSDVERLKQSTGEAKQELADLNTTVRPAVDASGVAAFRRQVADAKQEFRELSMLAAGGLVGGAGLRAGGAVNRAGRAQLSDFAHETGGM